MQKLTPTIRFILLVVRDAATPVNQAELVALTGGTLSSVIPTVQPLVRYSHVERVPGFRAFYCLPETVLAEAL